MLIIVHIYMKRQNGKNIWLMELISTRHLCFYLLKTQRIIDNSRAHISLLRSHYRTKNCGLKKVHQCWQVAKSTLVVDKCLLRTIELHIVRTKYFIIYLWIVDSHQWNYDYLLINMMVSNIQNFAKKMYIEELQYYIGGQKCSYVKIIRGTF